VATIAHGRGVPVIVDAAALPPPDNLTRFIREGADLAVFSGGKTLLGPQSSGLILGRADLVAACQRNANPYGSIGRTMKAGKEEICGLVRAVELYLARDHAADQRYWRWAVEYLEAQLAGLPGVRTTIRHNPTVPQDPRLRIAIDAQRLGFTADEIAAALAEGDPSIRVGSPEAPLDVRPHSLSEEDVRLVASRLLTVLTSASAGRTQPVASR
jgi:D-glucosaminate-6-phosphate ammonia-lyase